MSGNRHCGRLVKRVGCLLLFCLSPLHARVRYYWHLDFSYMRVGRGRGDGAPRILFSSAKFPVFPPFLLLLNRLHNRWPVSLVFRFQAESVPFPLLRWLKETLRRKATKSLSESYPPLVALYYRDWTSEGPTTLVLMQCGVGYWRHILV